MKISAVILASGNSERFGENKLLFNFNGTSLIEYLFKTVKNSLLEEIIVVTKYDKIISLLKEYGFTCVYNDDKENDLSKTIKLGVEKAKNSDGIMICVSDMPYLTRETINGLCLCFRENPDKICAVSKNGEPCNPVIFPKSLFNELLSLPPFSRGKAVINAHKELLKTFEVKNDKELFDIDTKDNLKN